MPRRAKRKAGLAALAATYDAAAIWLGLALARHRCGDVAGAEAALSALLERHCITQTPGFTALADRIGQQAGYGGWQGMTARGTILNRGGGKVLGAPDPKILRRVKGVVEMSQAGLAGWATRPAALTRPELFLHDAKGQKQPIRLGAKMQADATAPFLWRYRFRLSWEALRDLERPFISPARTARRSPAARPIRRFLHSPRSRPKHAARA